jgi:hypothetical protein
MTVRGYLSPVSERVEGALQDYIHMGKVVFRRGRYIHSKALEVVL